MCTYASEIPPAKLKGKSEVALVWSCSDAEVNAAYVHTMRSENAINHTMTFPKHWKTATQFMIQVSKMRQTANAHVSQKAQNPLVTCTLWGTPTESDCLDALCGTEFGSFASLYGSDTEVPQVFYWYFTCTKTHGSVTLGMMQTTASVRWPLLISGEKHASGESIWGPRITCTPPHFLKTTLRRLMERGRVQSMRVVYGSRLCIVADRRA